MLFSVADYKTRFGITGDAQNDRIHALALAVSAALANRGAVEYDGTETTEYHDGDFSNLLTVSRRPIISVTSVKVDPMRGFGATTEVASTDYEVLAGSGIIRRLESGWPFQSSESPSFGSAARSIQVVYRGGFTSIPADLKEGALIWAFYLNGKTPGVTSETIGSYSATYEQSTQGAIPREAKQFLGPFLSVNTGRRL